LELPYAERSFTYLPFEHSENVEDQVRGFEFNLIMSEKSLEKEEW